MNSREVKEIESEAEKILFLKGEAAIKAWTKAMKKFSKDMDKVRAMHQKVGFHVVREIEAIRFLEVKKK